MRKTEVEIIKPDFTIQHADQLFLIGSCFAENLMVHFMQHGFRVHKDPYGVVFNPLSLAKNLRNLLNGEIDERTIFQEEDVVLSFDANSKLYALDQATFKTSLKKRQAETLANFTENTVLFITFGTAVVYIHESLGIVANCHKKPNQLFTKRIVSAEEIVEAWQPLIQELAQKGVHVVFTVSPVRHSKEGLVQNNLSKANLLVAVHALCNSSSAYYFPAYELVMDELRDYAYFEVDGVHPNEHTVQSVWERVQTTFFDEATQALAKSFHQLVVQFAHRFIHPEGLAAKRFVEQREQSLAKFKAEHPGLNYAYFEGG
jgi:hypothetical protein